MKSLLFFLCLMLCFGQMLYGQSDPFSAINSPYDEQLPVLSPDHTMLLFTRAHHPDNIGGERDPGDIWSSFLYDDGSWSEPKNERSLNTSGYNGVLGFTLDARGLYLLNHYPNGKSNVTTQGIARTVRNGKKWNQPENIKIPYYRNQSSHYSGYISPDGEYLLLSLESYRTMGGEDIYVCFNEGDGKWSEPKNLGKSINTTAQEFTPFLSSDSKTLYFSSNGHGGAGSSDVFTSQRLDDSWQRWTEPEPVSNINTQGREMGYRLYEGSAIYVSTLNSDGFSDLKLHSDDIIRPIRLYPPLDSVIGPTPEPSGEIVFGTVKDANSRQAVLELRVAVSLDGTNIEVENNGSSGYYEAPMDGAGTYRIQLDAPGYMSISEEFTLEEQDVYRAMEKNFLLQPIEVGTTVQLPNVLFQRSSPNILPASYAELDRVVAFMGANPDVEIRLEGHTDNTGVPKHNLRLSKARVESVKEYLVSKGVSSKRISGKGYGGTKPLADNGNEETRRLNRRVEFTITKN